MAYERRNFRIGGPDAHALGSVLEFDPSRQNRGDGHGWCWLLTVVTVVAVGSFLMTRGCLSRDKSVKTAEKVVSTASETIALVKQVVEETPTELPATSTSVTTNSPEALAAARWLEAATDRASVDRALLERLAVAEREGRLRLALDTLEKLRTRPSVADLEDAFARRLGTLNMTLLFSKEPMSGVVSVPVRAKSSVARVAREHGTTTAAVRKLNNLGAVYQFPREMKVRILEFPRATLAIHKCTRIADLTINGRFFRRYYVGPFGAAAHPGAYPITRLPGEGPRERLKALGIRFVPTDLEELDMFLAPGATIAISEM